MDFEGPSTLSLLIGLPLLYLVVRRTLAPMGTVQRTASLLVRAAVASLLILALAGAVFHRKQAKLFVVFLTDCSQSISQESRGQAESFLADGLKRLSGRHEAAVAGFAAEPSAVQRVAEKARRSPRLTVSSATDETDIASTLDLARATFPSGYSKRIVLLTDGNETVGDAEQAALLAASEGVRIFTVPLRSAQDDLLLVEGMDAPSEVKRGEPFVLRARCRVRDATRVTARLLRDKFMLAERNLDVPAGASNVEFHDRALEEGIHTYEVECEAGGDSRRDNNRATSVVMVKGRPRVLYLEGNEPEGRYLMSALEAENFAVELRGRMGMPSSLAELSGYDLVVLSDVPATALTNAQMEVLRAYVSDLGGGFIMLGGDESFGLGG
ncbi:MAG: VWA domain-containing protein, partial [Planctomycetes bacterium]|nr:VWA domain-containing protein [Planctomycetota bacterium]